MSNGSSADDVVAADATAGGVITASSLHDDTMPRSSNADENATVPSMTPTSILPISTACQIMQSITMPVRTVHVSLTPNSIIFNSDIPDNTTFDSTSHDDAIFGNVSARPRRTVIIAPIGDVSDGGIINSDAFDVITPYKIDPDRIIHTETTFLQTHTPCSLTFLDLPTELRIKIYEFAQADLKPLYLCGDARPESMLTEKCPIFRSNLLLANRQIYAEFQDILIKHDWLTVIVGRLPQSHVDMFGAPRSHLVNPPASSDNTAKKTLNLQPDVYGPCLRHAINNYPSIRVCVDDRNMAAHTHLTNMLWLMRVERHTPCNFHIHFHSGFFAHEHRWQELVAEAAERHEGEYLANWMDAMQSIIDDPLMQLHGVSFSRTPEPLRGPLEGLTKRLWRGFCDMCIDANVPWTRQRCIQSHLEQTRRTVMMP